MRRQLLIARCIWASGFSFGQWLVGMARGTLRAELADRFRDGLGWFSPAMAPHWERIETPGEDYHDRKNVTTEWTRLDAQRASKFFSFWIVTGWGVAIFLGLALAGLVVGLVAI